MAIIYPQHQQPQIDRRAEALSRINDAFNSAATLRDLQNQKHLSSAMFGTPGADFGDLTKKHAPGLDPKLAGPALAVTKDAMAKPGLMTGGSWAGQRSAARRGAKCHGRLRRWRRLRRQRQHDADGARPRADGWRPVMLTLRTGGRWDDTAMRPASEALPPGDRRSREYISARVERVPPLRAIRFKCGACMGGDPDQMPRGEVAQAIDDCGSVTCPLWAYRYGSDPWRSGSEAQRAAARASIARARARLVPNQTKG